MNRKAKLDLFCQQKKKNQQTRRLQNPPRDAEKLERLLKVKRRQKEEAMHIEDTQRLVTEIEMLKVVLYLVMGKRTRTEAD